MADHPRSLPQTGNFAAHPLPRVLLAAWSDAWTGALELERDRLRKRILWKDGVPVFVESNLASESLGVQLVDAERITRDDHERVSEHMQRHDCREGAALLALGLMDPKELFLALRDQVRRRIVEAFGWPDGQFAFAADDGAKDEAQAFRVDPLALVQQGLAAHWSPERLLADLEGVLTRHPVPSERFDALSGRVAIGPESQALVDELTPERSFGESVYRSPSPERMAAAWLLAHCGALDFQDGPPAANDGGEGAADPDDTQPDIEFQFEATRASDEDTAPDAAADADADALSPEAEELRKQILGQHERIDELSHYELLGVEADAAETAIKKAYFGLAKRIHPDAVARIGLAEIHREANELFARVAQAYQVLSDPKRRSAYDEQESAGTPSTDANRLAQAETLYRKAEIMLKLGNFKEALEFLRPCVELWPEEADYQSALGWALYKARPSDPDGAQEHLRKAMALRPEEAITCFRLGMVLRKLGEDEESAALLERAKAIEKKS